MPFEVWRAILFLLARHPARKGAEAAYRCRIGVQALTPIDSEPRNGNLIDYVALRNNFAERQSLG
jgi:hypothetical protein